MTASPLSPLTPLTPLHAAALARLDAWLAEAACDRRFGPGAGPAPAPGRDVRRRVPLALPLRHRVEPCGC